jgi:hypothetical protein
MRAALLALMALAALAACGNRPAPIDPRDVGLNGPDEFGVLPALPLELPATADLPLPTPGGPNRTDRNPVGEGLLALGGDQAAGLAGDPSLIDAVTRFGVTADIRQTLVAEEAGLRAQSAR